MIPDAEMHVYRKERNKKRLPKPASEVVPPSVQAALRAAMKLEGVPDHQFYDYVWLIQHESGGRVDARNAHSSARGLFQLLRAQYSLNPHGEESFGNAVEECQGGIRYVKMRYQSSSAAKAFWEEHHWY